MIEDSKRGPKTANLKVSSMNPMYPNPTQRPHHQSLTYKIRETHNQLRVRVISGVGQLLILG
jgi:hypothetical protein